MGQMVGLKVEILVRVRKLTVHRDVQAAILSSPD